MLLVERNTNFINWSIGMPVTPLPYKGEVVITFDPSKTNMAMIIGTPDGNILDMLEFSGNNRGRGPTQDTTVFCQEVRTFLKEYLIDSTLYIVAVEQAITKQGTNYHHSNMVLTEIRSNLLNFFLSEFGIRVLEINNWSWKHAILPEGYRGKFEKGSKKFFVRNMPDSPLAKFYEADMTDCYCIYQYVIKNRCQDYTMLCNQAETYAGEYEYVFTTQSSPVIKTMRRVLYNPTYTFEENLNYYLNRILGKFYLVVPVDVIDVKSVYSHSIRFNLENIDDKEVVVMVWRS